MKKPKLNNMSLYKVTKTDFGAIIETTKQYLIKNNLNVGDLITVNDLTGIIDIIDTDYGTKLNLYQVKIYLREYKGKVLDDKLDNKDELLDNYIEISHEVLNNLYEYLIECTNNTDKAMERFENILKDLFFLIVEDEEFNEKYIEDEYESDEVIDRLLGKKVNKPKEDDYSKKLTDKFKQIKPYHLGAAVGLTAKVKNTNPINLSDKDIKKLKKISQSKLKKGFPTI